MNSEYNGNVSYNNAYSIYNVTGSPETVVFSVLEDTPWLDNGEKVKHVDGICMEKSV